MVAQDTAAQPVNALTLEGIQKHLESATVDRYWRQPQWDPEQDPNQTIAEAVKQTQQAQAALTPEQRQKAHHHLTAGIQALKTLGQIDPRCPAAPEDQASFELAWKELENARIELCETLYERIHPIIGTIEGPPDLSSRPYMMKHGLWPKECKC